MSTSIQKQIFDTCLKKHQRLWAKTQIEYSNALVLREEVGLRIIDRIKDLKNPPVKYFLTGQKPENLILFLKDSTAKVTTGDSIVGGDFLFDFDKDLFPLANLESIWSCLHIHWLNKPDFFAKSACSSLQSGGNFAGVLLGGDTLFELRSSIVRAQIDIEGGVSPRVSPMMGPSDIGNLLTESGFTDVTVDIEDIQILYPDLNRLVVDLKLMGESNAVLGRKPYFRRDTFSKTSEYYNTEYGRREGIPATFQLLWFNSWKSS